MGHMKRAVLAAAAILMAAVLVPATASAADLQIGVTASPVISPTCPANAQGTACKIVLTQVTAYETLRDGVSNPDTIKQSGVISAFTLGLAGTSLITPKVLSGLDKSYGGPPEAQLTVLRPTGTPSNPYYRVAAESTIVKLRPELGKVAEFPLVTPLPVVRGEMLALTVPTWAPVLSFELATNKFAYVQGRANMKTTSGSTSCDTTGGANLAQIVVGELSTYGCSYPGTRIEYSALEITTPAGFTSQVRKHLAAIRAAGVRVIKR
jgi:hypothetical protein